MSALALALLLALSSLFFLLFAVCSLSLSLLPSRQRRGRSPNCTRRHSATLRTLRAWPLIAFPRRRHVWHLLRALWGPNPFRKKKYAYYLALPCALFPSLLLPLPLCSPACLCFWPVECDKVCDVPPLDPLRSLCLSLGLSLSLCLIKLHISTPNIS